MACRINGHFHGSYRTASDYMRLAEHSAEIDSNVQSSAHFSIASVLRSIRKPHAREEKVSTGAGLNTNDEPRNRNMENESECRSTTTFRLEQLATRDGRDQIAEALETVSQLWNDAVRADVAAWLEELAGRLNRAVLVPDGQDGMPFF